MGAVVQPTNACLLNLFVSEQRSIE